MPSSRRAVALLGVGILALSACSSAPAPSVPPPSGLAHGSAAPSAASIRAAPGSSSSVYRPNPGAIVVAIDPGHGGCLDWGVPNPFDNRTATAEKTMTLGIGVALRALLEAQGITVVMTRQTDAALAGDLYPPLGCQGAPFRDANGDGKVGFGPTVPEGTLARDELSARLDLANLVRADALVSIHINSTGQPIALTQTFYTDETPWGRSASLSLARQVQAGVVGALRAVAGYPRQDRGVGAVNYYIVAPTTTTGSLKEPRRGALMPSVLTEVGSISLRQEASLLTTASGQQAAAAGIMRGLIGYFGERQLAARFDATIPGGQAGVVPAEMAGGGPPFWAPVVPSGNGAMLKVRITNTGMQTWPSGVRPLVGWQASAQPYLGRLPGVLTPLDVAIPALDPGAAIDVQLPLQPPSGGRQVGWITLEVNGRPLTDGGSPPLQVASAAP